ncbi:IS66 family transposase [Streptomyces sp. WZ-12]|uniref:IS66 family transposase n=1 Tax=Streptomyces sp. WZ-12 TaxID=3030210 RepID=UPI00406D3263
MAPQTYPVTTGELAALRTAVTDGIAATAARSSKTEAKHHALFQRLDRRWDDYLRWVHDPALPFDNNAAEQTIRMAKLRIKISGSLRTCAPCKEPATSPRSAPTSPPPTATASRCSTSSPTPCAADPGHPPPPNDVVNPPL